MYITAEIVYWTLALDSKFLESRDQVFTHMSPYPGCYHNVSDFHIMGINVFKNRKEEEGKGRGKERERRTGKLQICPALGGVSCLWSRY